MATGTDAIYLKHLPLGFWVKMDKYDRCPRADLLDDGQEDAMRPFVFIEPCTSDVFVFRNHKVKHNRVITATACQGRTMRAGVVIDCGRHYSGSTRKEDGDWWLELYVMLSRATRLDDLLLLRAPPSSFLLQGPPPDLQKRLQSFAARTKTCRAHAEKLVRKLGFSIFLH